MLLRLRTTHHPATDLGFLLHKHPAKVQTFEQSFGEAVVFYPHANEASAEAVLMLRIDPVALVRNRRGPGGEGFSLQQYVNDRPYVASSFMSVAIAQVFGSALSGRCRDKPELVDRAIPLCAHLSAVPCRGGEILLRKLFEPLGHEVIAQRLALDEQFPDWGESPYFSLELRATLPLRAMLAHLYVLLPVLDDDKHYWVDEAELEKLLRHGEGWLAAHPEKELIAQRYLKHQRKLAAVAMERLRDEDQVDLEQREESRSAEEDLVEQKISLNQHRLDAVMRELSDSNAESVLDLGCSGGNLLRRLLAEKQFTRIVGFDVSHRVLEIAEEKLHLDRLPPSVRKRIELMHGSLTYRDKRLNGFDAAAVVEVIEHLDPSRLASFERALFECARPNTVIVTTPNVEYNVRFPTLPAGRMRHRDHRFEWTRAQFAEWAEAVAKRFVYEVRFAPIGEVDEEVGPPTQMAVFSRVNA